MNKEEIKKIIPYQEPFIFIDEVERLDDNNVSGFYQTSPDDYYFKGHFVDFPIMPGVLVVEALAQISTIPLRKRMGDKHKDFHFLAYDVRSAQFYKSIFPGDKIKLQAEILGFYENRLAHIKAQALVGDELKAEARFSVAVVDKEEFKQKYSK